MPVSLCGLFHAREPTGAANSGANFCKRSHSRSHLKDYCTAGGLGGNSAARSKCHPPGPNGLGAHAAHGVFARRMAMAEVLEDLPSEMQQAVCTHLCLPSVRALRRVSKAMAVLVGSRDFQKAWRALNQVEHQWQNQKKKLSFTIASVDDDELETELEAPNHPPPPLPPPPPVPTSAPASAPEPAAPAHVRSSTSLGAGCSTSPSRAISPSDKADTTAQKRKRRWRELAGERQAAASAELQRMDAFFRDVDEGSLEVEETL